MIPGLKYGISIITLRRAIKGCLMNVFYADKEHSYPGRHIKEAIISPHSYPSLFSSLKILTEEKCVHFCSVFMPLWGLH